MALTLPSSNENPFYNKNIPADNGQVSTQFNGGLTKTTPTLTPTRLKNIEEQFLEHSSLPPKPFLHDHMAGFVPPSVNIKLNVKPQSVATFKSLDLLNQSQNSQHSVEYYSSNSNSNDSFIIHQNASDGGYSSETNSSADAKNSFIHSFPNFVQSDSSSSGATKMRNTNNSAKKKCNSRGGGGNTSQTKSNPDQSGPGPSMKSSQTKKSTRGGRKPNHSHNLTPEEELKRAKRRERNKIAAARCRKRRVDQTNQLMEQTRELKNRHEELVKSIKTRLDDFYRKLNAIESHEKRCSRKIRLLPELIGRLNLAALNTAMEPLPDDDIENDLNAQYASSSQDDFPPAASPPPVKRKRPDSLSLAPMPFTVKTEPLDSPRATVSGTTVTTDSANHFTTPSNGLFDLNQLESTGLTPLNPTLTPVDLTPSTLAAFFKSIASPMDEQKKLLSM